MNSIRTSVQDPYIYYTLIVFYKKKKVSHFVNEFRAAARFVIVISAGYPIHSSEYGESGFVFKKYTPDALMKENNFHYFIKHFKQKINKSKPRENRIFTHTGAAFAVHITAAIIAQTYREFNVMEHGERNFPGPAKIDLMKYFVARK